MGLGFLIGAWLHARHGWGPVNVLLGLWVILSLLDMMYGRDAVAWLLARIGGL
jgi:hypothetical protein